MSTIVECVSGSAFYDNKLYLVYRLRNTIHVFSADLYRELKVITVKGMRFPLHIVACHDNRQLYVADSGNCPSDECIWRVSAVKPSQYRKWLSTGSADVQSMSVRSSTLLVTLPGSLRRYSTTGGHLMCEIMLPLFVEYLYHAVETQRGTFVVGHRGTELSDLHAGVSKLFSMLDSIHTWAN